MVACVVACVVAWMSLWSLTWRFGDCRITSQSIIFGATLTALQHAIFCCWRSLEWAETKRQKNEKREFDFEFK